MEIKKEECVLRSSDCDKLNRSGLRMWSNVSDINVVFCKKNEIINLDRLHELDEDVLTYRYKQETFHFIISKTLSNSFIAVFNSI